MEACNVVSCPPEVHWSTVVNSFDGQRALREMATVQSSYVETFLELESSSTRYVYTGYNKDVGGAMVKERGIYLPVEYCNDVLLWSRRMLQADCRTIDVPRRYSTNETESFRSKRGKPWHATDAGYGTILTQAMVRYSRWPWYANRCLRWNGLMDLNRIEYEVRHVFHPNHCEDTKPGTLALQLQYLKTWSVSSSAPS